MQVHIEKHMELHRLYPNPFQYKSFAERNESLDSLVYKRPSPPFSLPAFPSTTAEIFFVKGAELDGFKKVPFGDRPA